MDRCLRWFGSRRWALALGVGIASAMSIAPAQAQEVCGGNVYPFPYTDVAGVGAAFCPGIMEAYVTGVSKGTTPTTFGPNQTVTRVQMTTFLQRSLDQGLARTSRRAALNQWWTPQTAIALRTTSVGGAPQNCAADGENIWTPTYVGDAVAQVQASTGKVLGSWTATLGVGVVAAAGEVFVTGYGSPGTLFEIDPTQAPGAAPVVASNLGDNPVNIAFDGVNLWTANFGPPGTVSIISPQATTPYPVTTISTGFNQPYGILFDGTYIWVTDYAAAKLFKLASNGSILQTVAVGAEPQAPVFDGANIWVPNFGASSITVVQASTGTVVATILADVSNNLNEPATASFDGERVLVANFGDGTVSLFKAADLSLIANVSTGSSTEPYGACSDGVNFWVTLITSGKLQRF
jgi:hypothetical protein